VEHDKKGKRSGSLKPKKGGEVLRLENPTREPGLEGKSPCLEKGKGNTENQEIHAFRVEEEGRSVVPHCCVRKEGADSNRYGRKGEALALKRDHRECEMENGGAHREKCLHKRKKGRGPLAWEEKRISQTSEELSRPVCRRRGGATRRESVQERGLKGEAFNGGVGGWVISGMGGLRVREGF